MVCGVQLKNLLMAAYFAADHVVWAGQAGVLTDKDTLARSAILWRIGSIELLKRIYLINLHRLSPI